MVGERDLFGWQRSSHKDLIHKSDNDYSQEISPDS